MSAPKTLGRYELVEKLAVGGMAEIYIARVKSVHGFQKEYVLKLIHPKHGDDEEFMRMLVDEAKLTAQMTHVNIAQVIDLGIHDETYYIVMEYIRGRDLYQILNQAYDMNLPVPIGVCAFIAKEIAAGLHYAHSKHDNETGQPLNLVHRDISPQNILVSWDGEVKIIDFGVAKAALAARPETQAGVIKGKFRYMSPEQAWGEKLDGRSDVFSAGLCLYEMATSSMAYDDDPDLRKMLVKMREANFRPPAEIRSDIDADFAEIMMRALERRRHQRYGSAEEFELALNRYLAGHDRNLTRGGVRNFMARLFPDESPYKAPSLLSMSLTQTNTEPLEEVDVIQTMDLSVRDVHELAAFARGEDEVDTGDRTARTVVNDYDDFDSEKTELFSGDQDAIHPEEHTAQLDVNSGPVVAMLERDGPRPGSRGGHRLNGVSARPVMAQKPPTSVPTAWVPKEFVENAAPRPTARAIFSEIMQTPEKRKAVLPYIVAALAALILIMLMAVIF